MTNKFHLSSIAILVGGIALTGCASKQTWSPELEDARQAYEQVSNDPLVTALAAAELDKAKAQLRVAENASDYFKGTEVIAHEASLAKLKAFEAQQTARALAAKDNLRLAQAGAPLNPLYSQPVMAAATPPVSQNQLSYTQSYTASAQGGHSNSESTLTETQQIAQQLAALSQQIIQLQQRIESGATQSHTQQYAPTTAAVITPVQSVTTANTDAPRLEAAENVISAYANNTAITAITNESLSELAEPTLGAAKPVPAETQSISAASLHEELRAMNAHPSDRGMELTLGERYFEADSARIWQGRAARHLDNIAAVMAENPSLVVDIQGHTDNSGNADARKNLSSDRATAVKSALVLRGITASRISSAGYADAAPLADNNTPLGRLQNRRVEIVFPDVAQ